MAAVQVQTLGDLLSDLSEKIGETSQDSANNRKRKIQNSYNFIANQRLWWWQEATGTRTTTTALYVALPDDFRAFHAKNPLKVGNNWYVMIPFADSQLYTGAQQTVSLPHLTSRRRAYIYGTNVYFVQESMTAGLTVTFYYYKVITPLDLTTDEPIIPLQFREMISLYAAGMHLKSQGGDESVEGSDYLELYDSYLRQMEAEDDRRRRMNIKRRAKDPEETLIYEL